jgi:plastocyanin
MAYGGSYGTYGYDGTTGYPGTTAYGPGGIVQSGYYAPGTTPGTTAGGVPNPMPSRVTTEATKARISDEGFEPATITIPVGTTVRWTNDGKQPHTVSSSTGAWESGDVLPGKDFTATFTATGTFEYYCKYHKGMKGTVIVK